MKEVGMLGTTIEPDQIITRKPLKSIEVVVNNEEKMSLEIAQRLLKLNVDAHELEIIRTNILSKDVAYTGLNADQRRIIDYMCRSLHVDEIERDGRLWHTSFDFFRKLFPDPKTHEEIRSILNSLAENRFRIRNVKTGTVENFAWLNTVIYTEGKGTITIEITARVSEYHRIPTRTEISAYGGYTQYYVTASLGLLLSHQHFFHFLLGRRVEWGLKNKNLKLKETPIEITVNEMRTLWGLSETTKPYDIERYWLKDACARMSVATQIRISHYETLRSAARGKRIYAYRLYICESTKDDFVNRFSRFLDLARKDHRAPQQTEMPLSDAEDRAQRLAPIKQAFRELGAYNGQLQELESLTEPDLCWVEGQMAIWASAGSAIYKQYKNEGNKEQTRMGLLWRCIKHRLALQTEYPRAFLAIERQKKKEEVKKDAELKAQEKEVENHRILAKDLVVWFSSLPSAEQNAFIENALRELPEPNMEKLYCDGMNKVFRDGRISPYLPFFKELAIKNGYEPAVEAGFSQG
jgi:hypothetical protein